MNRLGEKIICNPSIKMTKGEKYPLIDIEKITPGVKTVRSTEEIIFSGQGGARFESGDVVMARITPCLENGKIAIANFPQSCALGSTELFVFRGKPNETDTDYIFYLFCMPHIRQLAVNSMTGASGRQRADLKFIKKIQWNFPSLDSQKRISEILSAYDDLIENNNKRIKVLEHMSQELYKEWFVRFRFPGYEEVQYENGLPKGWGVVKILNNGIFHLVKNTLKKFDGIKQYFATADVDGDAFVSKGEQIDYQNRPSRAQNVPTLNSVYFARMSKTYKICSFTKQNKQLLDKIVLSSGFVGFDCDEKYYGFLRTYIASDTFDAMKDCFATGATQVSLTDTGLAKIKVLLPNEKLVLKFSSITKPIIDEIVYLQHKNDLIAKQRDLLLPRLMSGKLEIKGTDDA